MRRRVCPCGRGAGGCPALLGRTSKPAPWRQPRRGTRLAHRKTQKKQFVNRARHIISDPVPGRSGASSSLRLNCSVKIRLAWLCWGGGDPWTPTLAPHGRPSLRHSEGRGPRANPCSAGPRRGRRGAERCSRQRSEPRDPWAAAGPPPGRGRQAGSWCGAGRGRRGSREARLRRARAECGISGVHTAPRLSPELPLRPSLGPASCSRGCELDRPLLPRRPRRTLPGRHSVLAMRQDTETALVTRAELPIPAETVRHGVH